MHHNILFCLAHDDYVMMTSSIRMENFTNTRINIYREEVYVSIQIVIVKTQFREFKFLFYVLTK